MSMNNTDKLALANLARKNCCTKTGSELVKAALPVASREQTRQVEDRLLQMPETCKKTYLRAMSGKSAKSAIRAMCAMCFGWADFRKEIPNCTDQACPLYPYRPYSKG